jgi:uncharacterized glyoxalase superfamily protein PhnB
MQAQVSLTPPPLTKLSQPVPELPVQDVALAQRHYCEKLGFEAGWLVSNEDGSGGEIGSVKRGELTVFFRRRARPFDAAIHWVYAVDIQATYAEMKSRGSNIVDPLEKKPWGFTQFTVEDLDGNRFYVHGD